MSPKRREQILAALADGRLIYRHWAGRDTSGYLSHRLEGVKALKEIEVDDLKHEGVIEIIPPGHPEYRRSAASFKPLRLREGAQ